MRFSPLERCVQMVVFIAAVAFIFTCLLPLVLSMIEWIFNIGNSRKRG